MSDAIDDAAWPLQLNNPSLVVQRRRVSRSPGERSRRGRRSADPHPSESGDPCLRSVWQGSH